MAQVTEDILLSRIDQSGFRPRCVNMMDKPLLPIEVSIGTDELFGKYDKKVMLGGNPFMFWNPIYCRRE